MSKDSKVHIQIQRWEGNKAKSSLINAAQKTDIVKAIKALDNKITTEVLVEHSNGSYLQLGGGAGRYHVIYGNEQDDFFTLSDVTRIDGKEELVTGGQLGVFDARFIVSQQQAVRAAETFYELGQRDSQLVWVKD